MNFTKATRLGLLLSAGALALAACDGDSEVAAPGDILNINVTGGGGDGGDTGAGDNTDPTLVGDNNVDFTASACGTGFTETTFTANGVTITACAFDETSANVEVSGGITTLTGNFTMAAGNLYVLDGPTFIGQNPVDGTDVDCSAANTGLLTIEPGAVIGAKNDDTNVDTLVVSPCSQIDADGTRFDPIIMTTLTDLADADVQGSDLSLEEAASNGFIDETGAQRFSEATNTARWGGVVINGLAPINDCPAPAVGGTDACIKSGEGNSGNFGGDQPEDNSGTFRFVRIQYAGFPFTDTNELNGLALQGVGSGTTLEFIQVHNNADDGIEFFGGTANARFLVISDADDDSIDWTDGWTGSVQYAVVLGADSSIQADANTNDNQIEGDNNGDAPDTSPRSFPTISNFTFVGNGDAGLPSGSDGGVTLRAGTAAVIANGIISGTREPGVSFTQNSANAAVVPEFFSVVVAETDLENAGASQVVSEQGDAGAAIPASFEDSFASGNASGNTVLGSINLINGLFLAGSANIAPTFEFPVDGSGDLNSNSADDDTVTITRQGVDLTVNEEDFNPFLQVVDYVGAFDPSVQSVGESWLREWVLPVGLLSGSVQSELGDCPAGTVQNTNRSVPAGRTESIICTLSGTLTDDVTLVGGALYELDGSVFVGNDLGAAATPGEDSVTLTIAAGVTIFAASDDPQVDTLIVSRGNRISINGTDTDPVIMTNLRDIEGAAQPVTGNFDRWGGLVINGRAPINDCPGETGGTVDCVKFGEGNSGLFGGATADDDSGDINYLQVRFAGFPFTDTNELNGIALQGVGSGTDIDFVEVVGNADDGIEFFGGTAQAKHVVITNANDDSIDWTDGWQGYLQYALVVGGPDTNDNVFEGDNNGDSPDATPISVPVISNVTATSTDFAGPATDVGSDDGIVLRAGTEALVANTIVTFTDDDASSFAQNSTAGAPVAPLRVPLLRTVLSFGNGGDDAVFDADASNEVLAAGLNTDAEAGLPIDPTAEVLGKTTFPLTAASLETFYTDTGIFSGSTTPTAAEKAADAAAFLDDVSYPGALSGPNDNWYVGWTYLTTN